MQQIEQVFWDTGGTLSNLKQKRPQLQGEREMNQDNLNENMIEIEELESKIAPDQAATFID
jgi:hypothetical protein